MTVSVRRITRLAGIAVAAAGLTLASTGLANADDVHPHTTSPKIVGGDRASIKDYPWTVFLADSSSGGQFCGGTLVTPTKVVTAAHCTVDIKTNPGAVKVVVGREDKTSQDGQAVDVTGIWVHPKYEDAAKGYDASVLTLAKPVDATPLPLADKNDAALYKEGTSSTVLGWGNTTEGGSDSQYLLKVDVPLTSDDTCSKAYKEYNKDAMICAGVPEGGKDSCQGDSGGPLTNGGKLIGIVSWGQGCAQKGFPGIYTRVMTYYDDIKAQLGS